MKAWRISTTGTTGKSSTTWSTDPPTGTTWPGTERTFRPWNASVAGAARSLRSGREMRVPSGRRVLANRIGGCQDRAAAARVRCATAKPPEPRHARRSEPCSRSVRVTNDQARIAHRDRPLPRLDRHRGVRHGRRRRLVRRHEDRRPRPRIRPEHRRLPARTGRPETSDPRRPVRPSARGQGPRQHPQTLRRRPPDLYPGQAAYPPRLSRRRLRGDPDPVSLERRLRPPSPGRFRLGADAHLPRGASASSSAPTGSPPWPSRPRCSSAWTCPATSSTGTGWASTTST